MFVLVLAAEADETRQTMIVLIASLIGIAVLLTLLTVWYWFYTDPDRQQPVVRVPSMPGRREGTDVPGDEPDEGGSIRIAPPPPRPRPDETVARAVDRVADREGGSEPGAGSTERAGAGDGDAGGPSGQALAQTWDFVAAARRAEEEGVRIGRPQRPAAPRIRVAGRSGKPGDEDDGDELAVARRRREREAARGLSDEVWESVRRSVFDKLDG